MNDLMPESSADWSERKHRILGLALRAARLRRYRRSTGHGMVLSLVLAAGMVTWWAAERNLLRVHEGNAIARRTSVVQPQLAGPAAVNAKPPGVTIVWIHTDPSVLKRMEEPDRTVTWRQIGDDELLKCLAEAGTPTGLVEVGGRVVILPRDSSGLR